MESVKNWVLHLYPMERVEKIVYTAIGVSIKDPGELRPRLTEKIQRIGDSPQVRVWGTLQIDKFLLPSRTPLKIISGVILKFINHIQKMRLEADSKRTKHMGCSEHLKLQGNQTLSDLAPPKVHNIDMFIIVLIFFGYSWFEMLCLFFMLYSKVNQSCLYIYPLFYRFSSHRGHFQSIEKSSLY